MDKRPIGIFDSGVGGLTVVSEFLKILPAEEIIYFGDTARVPYGSKSKEIVTKYSTQIMNFLTEKNVKSVVIACNTVSSNSYAELAAKFELPIIEVVSAGANECVRTTKNNRVGVIGTERTIKSGAYEKYINEINPDISVYSKACPLFVPLAEEGWVNNSVSAITAEIYLQELIDKDIDALVLGCTHYPLLLNQINKVCGSVSVINPAQATALKMKSLLDEKQLCRSGNVAPAHSFFVSDNTGKFGKICNLVLPRKYDAKLVDIEEY
ncbi:glutamate racemase [Clostridia bacterium]|nr:glutamate racemase [Clostridia bacterium]